MSRRPASWLGSRLRIWSESRIVSLVSRRELTISWVTFAVPGFILGQTRIFQG